VAGDIAVTGAMGFIGGHVVRQLNQSGYRVRALVRPGPDARPVAPGDVRQVMLTNETDVAAALEGVSTVIHLAGRAHRASGLSVAELSALRRDNVEATQVLAHAARRSGVARFVFVSSIGAVTTSSVSLVTDGHIPQPDTLYGRTKLEAEEVVRAAGAARALEVVILRPPMVFGPGMKGNPLRLFEAVCRGTALPLAAIRNRRSFMYVGTLAAAILRSVESPNVVGQTFGLSDGTPMSTPDFVRSVATALGVNVRLFAMPVPLLEALGFLGDVLSRVGHAPLTSQTVRGLTRSLVVDDSRFREATGFDVRVPTPAALASTAEWFLVHRGSRP